MVSGFCVGRTGFDSGLGQFSQLLIGDDSEAESIFISDQNDALIPVDLSVCNLELIFRFIV